MTIIRRDDGQEFVLRLSPSVTHPVVPHAAVSDHMVPQWVETQCPHCKRTLWRDLLSGILIKPLPHQQVKAE